MALVPYRVSGPAADQRASERLLQLPGGITLRLAQWPSGPSGGSGNSSSGRNNNVGVTAQMPSGGQGGARMRNATQQPEKASPAGSALHCESRRAALDHHQHHHDDHVGGYGGGGDVGGAGVVQVSTQRRGPGPALTELANVGLVVWQAGFLLAEYLLRTTAPLGGRTTTTAAAGGLTDAWRDLRVVDLGAGSGVVGIALVLAGAHVVLTDLPHVVPLTVSNVAANCDPKRHHARVVTYRWGEDGDPMTGGVVCDMHPPDVITAADVLYHMELLRPLMSAIDHLSAPYTVSYISYRVRHGGEVAAFVGLAEAAGFAVSEVPAAELHEEYRGRAGVVEEEGDGEEEARADVSVEVEGGAVGARPVGSYGILRLCRRDVATGRQGLGAGADRQVVGVEGG